MPSVSEALKSFLSARKTDANADLIARWSMAMETQVLVGVRDGDPVAGKRSTYSNGSDTWHAIRVPHDAGTVPNWEDYELRYPFDTYADGIGMTGLDWQALCSRWVAYDFDALTGHAKGIGVSEDDLERVKSAAQRLPYVEVRKSTRGSGVHLYVYLDAIPCENHTVHAALARCILGMMSAEVGFDFASQIDACGGNMWVWHRKMTAENGGLSVIKKATKVLTAVDLPANWRDHIAVITKQRKKVRVNEVSDDKLDAFEVLASSQTIVALDDRHKAIIEALQQSSYTTLWIADHLVSVPLFNRVQSKLPKSTPYHPKRKAGYPLAGLIYCQHCQQPMYGSALHSKSGDKEYVYPQYICSTYAKRNGPTNGTCGRHPIDADLVLGWLTQKLQEIYLGPGRDALVREIKQQLKTEPKANKSDVERLQKRVVGLDREVSRLVKAIRTLDAAELVEELALVQAERDRVKAELAEAGKLTSSVDLDAEAERIADHLGEIGEQLTDSDPAVLREALRQFVSRITCRWETTKVKTRTCSRLIGGTVELWPQTPFSVIEVVAQAS